MKASDSLSNIRHLCSMGYDTRLLIPDVMRRVSELVSAENAGFVWVNEFGSPIGGYMSESSRMDLIETYLTDHCNRETERNSLGTTLAEFLNSRESISNTHATSAYNGSIIQEHIGQFGFGQMVRVAIRTQGMCFGMMALGRPAGDTPFSARNEQQLQQIATYIAQAFAANPHQTGELGWVDEGSEGLIVLDKSGNVHFIDDNARRTLYFATQPRGTAASGKNSDVAWAGTMLAHKLRLDSLPCTQSLQPSTARIDNLWGRFTFSARCLESLQTTAQPLVGVTIRHAVPLSLKAMRGIHRLPLSPRQQELCLLISQGLTNTQIAERMHIRPYTVGEYIAVVFDKLDVNNRESLVQKLLHSAELL